MPALELQDLRPSNCWPARVKVPRGGHIVNSGAHHALPFESSLLTPVLQALEYNVHGRRSPIAPSNTCQEQFSGNEARKQLTLLHLCSPQSGRLQGVSV